MYVTCAVIVQAGLDMLFSVDEDITARLAALVKDKAALKRMETAVAAVETALWEGRQVYVYGCGATGRLAKQMESNFWRPFWLAVKAADSVCDLASCAHALMMCRVRSQGKIWEKIQSALRGDGGKAAGRASSSRKRKAPESDGGETKAAATGGDGDGDAEMKAAAPAAREIGEQLIGEMTGADRALISSLEGFEDLQVIGRKQLEDRGIKRGDVVICVTEGSFGSRAGCSLLVS